MSHSPRPMAAVAIGRNEGERLVRCLKSTLAVFDLVVYVDSGSTDGSANRARELGALVVDLDTTIPFTAARARNAGFELAMTTRDDLDYVQFIDGDCELAEGWAERAAAYLDAHPKAGVVAGRRRERFPDASPYNRLADLEWNTEIGPAIEVGGDALVRIEAFVSAGKYDPTLIAGEDPEMCLRVRRAGYEVWRIDAEMTLHDANIHRFSQWWRRVSRAGHAYAESAHMHGAAPERYRTRELRSIVFWGGAVPVIGLGLAPLTLGGSLAIGAAGYGVLVKRIYAYRRGRDDTPVQAALYATSTAVGKVAEMQGVAQYAWNTFVRGQRTKLIEYKG